MSDLSTYPERCDSLINLRERIQAINATLDGIGSIAAEKTPVMGGASQLEDKIINRIVERDRLRKNYKAAASLVKCIKRGLTYLTETEYQVLDAFYMNRTKYYLDDLCERLGLEKSQVYRLKDQALYKFTIAMYGLVDF